MRRTASIIRWTIVALAVVAMALPAIVAALPGWVILQVDGRSMEPTYAIRDVIVAREPAADESFAVGDVISFQEPDGIVTHRIVGIEPDGSLITRGDANTSDDATPVSRENVVGLIVLHVPQPGASFVMELQNWPLRAFLILLVIGLSLLDLSPRSRREASVTPDGASLEQVDDGTSDLPPPVAEGLRRDRRERRASAGS